MNALDLVASAISNSFRSKTRTILTVLAIFIGAFTLTLTSGVGTGINRYIDDTVSSIGASDVMTVSKITEDTGSGPREYEPTSTQVESQQPGPTTTVDAITDTDLATLRAVDGALSVEPSLGVRPDYIQYADGTPYQVSVGSIVPGMTLELAAGAQPVFDSPDYEVAIDESYLTPLGFADADAAIGAEVLFGVTDSQGNTSTVAATVVGISEPGLVGGGGVSANDTLTEALYSAQSVGLSDAAAHSYSSAVLRFDAASSPEQVSDLKASLTAAGYDAVTVEDQIGTFKTVIDAIVLVLNAFAVIALVAAGFGIVNTLLMSVQERTREIGLMKAMGMGGGRVFTLFSLEAVFIGFLGS
ncbi:MAG: Permease, partial [Glaciihabitans sp.]|nr:Permease [Glaciihabitans sp.]